LIKQLLEHSFLNKLTHVPSALSMLTYVDTLFSNDLIVPYRDRIVLGKPFGSQAYYLVWQRLGFLDCIENLSVGVKHDEIDFVDYGEETMGNALGVATGIALAKPNQNVWVNITDATLQMGSTLEALQYIGHNTIKNIRVTVDYNNTQVTGEVDDILCVKPVAKWIDGHNEEAIRQSWEDDPDRPCIYFYKTIKGYGVDYMVRDPVKWHYRPIEDL
jgi:transketolase N-terminal domain/subunit